MSSRALAAVVAATLVALPQGAIAAPHSPPAVASADLDRVEAAAKHEGLPLSGIRVAGAHRLQLVSSEALPRTAFLRRASLLAFVVFKRIPTRVQEIEFTNRHGNSEQTCRIVRADFETYLRDRIAKAEYERRLGYHETHLAVASPAAVGGALPLPPLPPLPALPPSDALTLPRFPGLPAGLPGLPGSTSAPRPAPGGHPASAVTPAVAPLATLLGLSYGLALGGGRFDGFQLEYGQPLLSSLDLRPSVQIISPFSPVNYFAGSTQATEGLSFGCDLMATTRQHPGAGGLAFEGGLGARMASLQGDYAGSWPAMHLRVGVRWWGLSLGMRYPLLHRDGDPTATWEASLGYAVPFSSFGGF